MKNDPKKQTKGKKHEIASKMGKNQKIKNKTKKLRCSPNPKKVNDFTCYTEEDLHRLRDLWNIRCFCVILIFGRLVVRNVDPYLFNCRS